MERKGFLNRDEVKNLICKSDGGRDISERELNGFMTALNSKQIDHLTKEDMFEFYRKLYIE